MHSRKSSHKTNRHVTQTAADAPALDVFDVSEWEFDESMEGQVACIYNMYYDGLNRLEKHWWYLQLQCVQYVLVKSLVL